MQLPLEGEEDDDTYTDRLTPSDLKSPAVGMKLGGIKTPELCGDLEMVLPD